MRRDERAFDLFSATGGGRDPRDAFLAGWHAAMCARDGDELFRACQWCGSGTAPDDTECPACGEKIIGKPDGEGVFHATERDAAESDMHSRYWLPGEGWYYVDEEAQEPVGPFPTREAAVEAMATGAEPEVGA